jgi:peptidoglycan/xylan/chitin deacetylase (PgdA/CDA1 family)
MDDYHERIGAVLFFSAAFFFIGCTEDKSENISTQHQPSLQKTKTSSLKTFFTKKKQKVKRTTAPVVSDTLRIDTSKTYVYLTFDDGPQPGTLNCLDVLKEQNVKGTFFLIAEHALQSKQSRTTVDSLRKDSSCLIANHSYSHAFRNKYKLFYTRTDSATQDFIRAQDSMQIPYKIVRLPGNDSWALKGKLRTTKLTNNVSKQLDSLGYNIIGWDVEWNFSYKTGKPIQSTDSMLTLIRNAKEKKKTYTTKHIVLLTHDRMFRDASEKDSLAKLIRELRKDTMLVFQNVDRYPNVKLNQ